MNRQVMPTDPPCVSQRWLSGFEWYVTRYLKRHFNSLRISKGTSPHIPQNHAVICYLNHASWWDPLIAILLNSRFMAGKTAYYPIDSYALKKYPLFKKLGFYGIEHDTKQGAKQFLTITRWLLSNPHHAVWMTPGGKFDDIRNRVEFKPGLSHLATGLTDVVLLPIAIEYTFWEERTPEVFIEFGPVTKTGNRQNSKAVWQNVLEQQLANLQSSLAEKVRSREIDHFDVILDGTAGVGGIYDAFRRLISALSGRRYHSRHGESYQGYTFDD